MIQSKAELLNINPYDSARNFSDVYFVIKIGSAALKFRDFPCS